MLKGKKVLDWQIFVLFFYEGPLEFVEPDLSSLPPPRPMSPDPAANEKRDSISDKAKQGKLEEMCTL